MNNNFIIKTMSREELNFAIELASNEGWNPGVNDAIPFYDADPEGFLIGYLNGKPVGCISAVSYEQKFGFIGFYIVIPEMRGKGYGIKLWNAGMEKLAGQNIGLDGVIEQQENYKKSGFKLAYSNIRFEWINDSKRVFCNNVYKVQKMDHQEIIRYDKKFFPVQRNQFLKSWLKMPDSFSMLFIEKEEIKGYGVIRKCRKGFKIGPLFADNFEIAERLFLRLVSEVEQGISIYLDVPETNSDGLTLAEKYGMKKVFGTARMYTGEFPALPVSKIFGVTTFELG